MSVQWHTEADPEAAALACAHHIATLIQDALSGQEFATLAVSGGTTPKLLFAELVRARLQWDRIHLFWADERCVPVSSDQSNFRMTDHALIAPTRIPRRNVHRVRTEMTPDHAAKAYAEEIREVLGLDEGDTPRFDVIQLGMGADAHTASLFPGDTLIDDRDEIAAAVHNDKLMQWRVTLLPGVLLAAKHTVFLVSGADKAEAVRAVFKEEYNPVKYPAQVASHHGRRVAWFLDRAAAALMDAE